MAKIIKNKILTFAIISIILLFAACLRVHTFYLPHNHGDQIFYLGLAMKLERFGFKGYNLKGIDGIYDKNILAVVSSRDREKGSLLEGLEQSNVFYYSQESISNMPPAYSFLLMLSHKIFSPNKLYLSVYRNLGIKAIFLRPKIFFQSQFYAVWINFAFSLLFILVIFFMGKMFFNEKVGLWASLLMAMAPVDILTSQRLWADEMASFFSALCVLLFWQGRRKNNLLIIILSGISAGCAALTKQSGLFVVAVIFFSVVLIKIKYALSKKISFKVLFDKYLIVFILASVSVCAFWYVKITLAYGVPWYIVRKEGIEKVSGWFMRLNQRNRFGQLYYFAYLLPAFVFFYWESAKTVFRRIFTEERIILLVWFFLFFTILTIIGGKEERYMLPAYPAIAIFSSIAIENIRLRLNGLDKIKYLGNIMIVLIFSLAGVWSVNLGLRCVFDNCVIFNLF